MIRWLLSLTVFVFALGTSAFAADPPALTLKSAKLDPPDAIAETVRRELDPNAITIADPTGTKLLTIWLRKSVPVRATAEQIANGLTYREIPDGTLIGAVQLHEPFVDFRKQDLTTGVYTLRYAVQPDDGDHKDTAPHPEFGLLVPAASDRTAEPIELKTLIKRSSETTGGEHPGVMLLFPYHGKDVGPNLITKGNRLIVTTRRPVTADDQKSTLGFGLTVHGHSAAR